MSNIKFYARVKDKWIKRRSGLKKSLISELYDAINALDQKHKVKHWAIPEDTNPADYPELLEMEKIVSKHLDHYVNDFYIHDLFAYLKGDKKAIWLLRDTGTHYIPLLDNFEPKSIEFYKASIRANKYFYLIDKGQIKEITWDRVNLIIEEKMKLVVWLILI